METISPSSNSLSSNNNNSNWTNEQNTWFESALAIFDTETPDRWSNVAAMVPGKSEIDVKNQYEKLKADINKIEAGYLTCSPSFKLESDDDNDDHDFGIFIKRPTKFRSFDHERRKGVPWTEDEHRRFLMGLQVHGKGDWRSISRNFVRTKTPTQVASHAQKYYARQHADGKEKRRPSIHDITMVSLTHNPNSPERASSSSSSMITTGTHVMNNYPFEVAKINKNGGNNIRVFSSGFQYYQPTTYQVLS